MGTDCRPQVDRAEFARAMYWLGTACGQVRPDGKPRVTREQIECYYELLADVPADALWVAVKQTAAEHEYGGLPPAGVIRRVAVDLFLPEQPSALEAWEMVRRVSARLHRTMTADESRSAKAHLPERVRRAAERIGWHAIVNGDADVVRSNFIRGWDEETRTMRRRAMVPAAIAEAATDVRARLAGEHQPRIGRDAICQTETEPLRLSAALDKSRSGTRRRESA